MPECVYFGLRKCANTYFGSLCVWVLVSIIWVYVHAKCVWWYWQGVCCASLAPVVLRCISQATTWSSIQKIRHRDVILAIWELWDTVSQKLYKCTPALALDCTNTSTLWALTEGHTHCLASVPSFLCAFLSMRWPFTERSDNISGDVLSQLSFLWLVDLATVIGLNWTSQRHFTERYSP